VSNITENGFKIGASTAATEALDVAGNILASGSIIGSSAIINGVNIESGLSSLQSDLDAKKNVLIAGTNITIVDNTISSSGGGSDITQSDLDTKQYVLIAGTNITIVDNTISSSGGGSDITQLDLDLKQAVLTYDNDLVLNSIVVKPRFTKENYTPAEDGEIRCDILTVADVNISTLFSSKQDTLVAGTNITIVDNAISSSGGGGSDITQEDLDAKQDLIISSTNLTCITINASSAIINSVDIETGLTSLQTQVDGNNPYLMMFS